MPRHNGLEATQALHSVDANKVPIFSIRTIHQDKTYFSRGISEILGKSC